MHCGMRLLDVPHSIAKEAEAEAANLVPAAESAIQKARQAAVTLRGQPQELTLPYLHDLATSRLHSWLSAQKDVSGFQVASQQTGQTDLFLTFRPPASCMRMSQGMNLELTSSRGCAL